MDEEYIETEEFDAGTDEHYDDAEMCSEYVDSVLDNIEDSLD